MLIVNDVAFCWSETQWTKLIIAVKLLVLRKTRQSILYINGVATAKLHGWVVYFLSDFKSSLTTREI